MLFQNCRVGFANADADYLEQVLEGHTCELETFGMGENAQLRAVNIQRIHRPGYLGVEYDLTGLKLLGRVDKSAADAELTVEETVKGQKIGLGNRRETEGEIQSRRGSRHSAAMEAMDQRGNHPPI